MQRPLILLILPALLFLSACSLIPEYHQPEAPVPKDWPQGPVYPESLDEKVTGAIPWESFFTDPKLQQVIQAALDNNRDLRIAALSVEKMRILHHIQRSDLLPSVHGGARGSQQRVPADLSSTGRSMTAEQYGLELGITAWELDFFGRLRSLEQRALEEYLATEQARRSVQLMLISEVARAYLTLAMDRENLHLASSTLKAQEASQALIRRRVEVGLAPELDLRQVQTRVESARLDVARFTELTAQDLNALHLLVGRPVDETLLPENLSSLHPLKEGGFGTPSEVLLQRPDILQAESMLKAAHADIGAARAAFFPRITLTSSIGTASSELSGLFRSGSDTWSFSPSISVPIFHPRTWSGLEASKVEQEIAVARYERAIQAAFRDVADALARKGTLGDQMKAQESLVEAFSHTYRLSNARYEKGSDTYLSVLDAQRSLYSAQQGLIATRLARLANQVQLYAALGGGAGEMFPEKPE